MDAEVLEYGIDQLSAVVDTALLNLNVNPLHPQSGH